MEKTIAIIVCVVFFIAFGVLFWWGQKDKYKWGQKDEYKQKDEYNK